MSDIKTAIDNLQRFMPMFQAIMDLSDAAYALAGVDQEIHEKTAVIADLTSQAAELRDALDKTKSSIKVASADAKAKADKIMADAQAAADQVVADAQEKASKVAAESDRVAAITQASIDAANAAVIQANKDRNAAMEELADLNANIADVKAKIVNLLGVA